MGVGVKAGVLCMKGRRGAANCRWRGVRKRRRGTARRGHGGVCAARDVRSLSKQRRGAGPLGQEGAE